MYKLHSQFLICCIFTQTEPENLIIFCRNECTEQTLSPHLCISSPRQWSSLKSTWRPRKVSTLTNTRSPILSSLSPFLTEPASERLEIDSLAVFVRLLIWDVAEGSFAVGWDDLWGIFEGVAGDEDATLTAKVDGGEVAQEAWIVCGPSASASACTFVNFEGRVNIPFRGSHWKYRTPATEPSFLPMGSSKTIPAHWPGANWVSPTNWINPGLFPFTQTRSPTRKSSTNSSCVSEDGVLDAFSPEFVFSIGAATAKRGKDQKRFDFIFKQTTPKLRKIN